MSTLNVTNLKHGSSSTNSIVFASDGTCDVKASNISGHKNLIINGAMQVAQRTTSAATTTGIFVVDRFKSAIVGSDEASTTAQITLTSSDTGPWAKGFRNALQVTNGNQTSGAGDGDTQQITYMVEAQDIAQSGWDYTSASSYITLSFWVKSSVAQNFYGYLRSEDGTKQLYAFETGSLSANTWTKVTKTVPGNSNIQIDNNNEGGFLICLYAFEGADKTDSGQGLNSWGAYSSSSRTPVSTSTWWTTNDATFALTGVQLEVGDTATDFEHRTIADEEIRCQRYFVMVAYGNESAAGNGGSGLSPICTAHQHTSSEAYGIVRFPCRMNHSPDLYKVESSNYWGVFFNQTCDSCDTCTLNRSSTTGATIGMSGNLSVSEDHSCWFATFDSSARLGFDAEI